MSKWLYRAKAVFPLVAILTASVSAFAGIAMPRIMSHRGESKDRPENTMAAFRLAFERGVDGVECDVYCTSDGVPVIIHDSTTKRTAGSGTNLTVTASTWSQLKDVRVGAFSPWIGTEWEGETLPKFEDYLALLSMNSTSRCIVELKGNGANNLIQNVVAAVQAQPLATSNRVVFIAFDASLISAIRTALPDYQAWLLLNNGTYTGANLISSIEACNATGVDIAYQSTFSAADVAAVKAAGYSFAVWTCDSDDAAFTLALKGVDEIATNRGGAMKTSLAAMLVDSSATAKYLESFYFRYDFTDGTRQFIGSASQTSDPVTASAEADKFVAAYGQDGSNTAVHVTSIAYGSDTISGGSTTMNSDWTLALSLRPGSVNKGILFSVGRANATGSKVIFLASSSSPGKLYVGTARRKVKSGTYSDSNTRELAHEWELTTSADLTTGYHTIVASHVAGGTVTVYVDGELAGTVDTTLDCSAATCVFGNGIQFNQAHGTATFLSANGYSQSLDNPDVAFQDVRFYNSAFTAEDAAAYAALYPATLPGFSNLDQYAYVQSYGVNAIDTGYKATKTTTFKVDYQATSTSQNQGRIFGARGNFGANHYVNGSGQFAFNMGSAQSGHWKSLSVNVDTDRHWFTLSPATKGFTGTLYGADRTTKLNEVNDSTATSDKTATLNVHLFAEKDGDAVQNCGHAKIYSFIAETNNVPVAFFAPTIDASGDAGFTNVVAGTFHGECLSSPSTALTFTSGVGRAEDYRYRSGKFYSRIYASSADSAIGLVKFDGGEAAGTNAQYTARGRTAKIIAVPAEGYSIDKWVGDTWAIADGFSTTDKSIEVSTPYAVQLQATFKPNALLTVAADGDDSINWSSADWRRIDNSEETIAAPEENDVTIVAHKSFTLTLDMDVALSSLTVQADTNCVVTLVNGNGSLVTVETIVKSGVLQQGTASVLGATPQVTVEDGGTFDFNQKNVNDATSFHLAGAGAGDWPWALTSTGGVPSNYIHNFVLTDDATIGSAASSQLKVGYDKNSSSRGSMTLNGHTLAVTGGMWLTFRKIKMPGTGTILYNGRGTAFYESAINTEDGTTTFILGDGITQSLTVNKAATVNALEWRGCTLDTSSAALTVKSSLTGYGTTAKLTFADGASAVLEGDLAVTNALTASGALSLTRAAGVETNVTVAATETLAASGVISVGAGVALVIGANHPTATLAVHDNATLDLSRLCTNGVDVVFDAGNTMFQTGSTVSVKLGERTIGDQDGKKVVSWTTRPQGVKFVCGDEGQNCTFAAESDGLYVYRGFSVFLY